MRQITKKFKDENKILVFTFSRKGNSIITNAALKVDDKIEKKEALHSIKDFKKVYPVLKSFEKSLEFYNSLNISKQNPDDWEALRNIAPPKEGPNETYIFDEKSSGIYTPILEGIARANPRRMSSNGYFLLSKDSYEAYQKDKKNSRNLEAYRNLFKAYRLADLACHIGYYHNARKEKGLSGSDKAVVDKLMYLHDQVATEWRDELILEKANFEQFLKENKFVPIIQKVSGEFILPERPKTVIKKAQKGPIDVTIKEDEEKLASLLETLEKLENSLKSKDKRYPEDIDRIESIIESYKKRRDKLQKIISEKRLKLEKLQ